MDATAATSLLEAIRADPDLTPTSARILLRLAVSPSTRQQLEADLGIDPTGLSRYLRDLVAAGLVHLSPCLDHRRPGRRAPHLATLTASGEARASALLSRPGARTRPPRGDSGVTAYIDT